jgi:hypothetical protein
LGNITVKNSFAAALCAASLSLAAPAMAGSLSDPLVTPEVVAADTAESSPQANQGLIAALTVMMMIIGVGT